MAISIIPSSEAMPEHLAEIEELLAAAASRLDQLKALDKAGRSQDELQLVLARMLSTREQLETLNEYIDEVQAAALESWHHRIAGDDDNDLLPGDGDGEA
ncbi:MAG TPA: hypothetical protein VF094_08870 [Gaiellaceae bacterium]